MSSPRLAFRKAALGQCPGAARQARLSPRGQAHPPDDLLLNEIQIGCRITKSTGEVNVERAPRIMRPCWTSVALMKFCQSRIA